MFNINPRTLLDNAKEKWYNTVSEGAISAYKKEAPVAYGRLRESFYAKRTHKGHLTRVEIKERVKYGEYVRWGIFPQLPPRLPPYRKILAYVRKRNRIPRLSKRRQAFLLMRFIAIRGILSNEYDLRANAKVASRVVPRRTQILRNEIVRKIKFWLREVR